VAEFRLQAKEQGVSGIRVQDGTLRLRPTLAARSLGVVLMTIGAVFVIVAASARTPAAVVVGVAGVLGGVAGWRAVVAKVVAEPDGLTVTNHWRKEHLGWDEVQSVSVEVLTSSAGRLPYSSPIHPPHKFACGVIRLTKADSLVADALVSLPAAQSGDLPVAAELKAAVLARFRDNLSGPTAG